MKRLLVTIMILTAGAASATGEPTASFSWQFEGGGTTASLNGLDDSVVINVFLEFTDEDPEGDYRLAGWHYDLNAGYGAAEEPTFLMTGLWVMPEADRYGPTLPPAGDLDQYRSFADIQEQEPGVYSLPPGEYLIEKLTLSGTEMPSDGVICFDPEYQLGYNVVYTDSELPGTMFVSAESTCLPECLTVVPEPGSLLLLTLAGGSLMRRKC